MAGREQRTAGSEVYGFSEASFASHVVVDHNEEEGEKVGLLEAASMPRYEQNNSGLVPSHPCSDAEQLGPKLSTQYNIRRLPQRWGDAPYMCKKRNGKRYSPFLAHEFTRKEVKRDGALTTSRVPRQQQKKPIDQERQYLAFKEICQRENRKLKESIGRLKCYLVQSPGKKEDNSDVHSLTCTNDTYSVDSNTSCKKATKKVQFNPMATVYPCRETWEGCKRRWFTKCEEEANKESIRASAEDALQQCELRPAMDRLHALIRAKSVNDIRVDRDTLYDSEKTTGVCSHMCESDLARLLIDIGLRGVERLLFVLLDECKGQLRLAKSHSRIVLQAQASAQDATPDERAEAIAKQCETAASSKWAHILGQADAKAVGRDMRCWVIL